MKNLFIALWVASILVNPCMAETCKLSKILKLSFVTNY